MVEPSVGGFAHWRQLYFVLFGVIVLTAALNMLKVRAGFFTNHAADIAIPAWMYIGFRGLHSGRRITPIQKFFGRSPEFAALSLFFASTLTEISQYYWPHGIFRGHFDPFDIISFGVGISACYALEKFTSKHQTK